MNSDLYTTLVERNLINVGTLIEGITSVRGLGGMPQRVTKRGNVVLKERGSLVCQASSSQFRVRLEDIKYIDGMEPGRLASVYNIRINGEVRAPGKKRGRKPKVRG